MKSIMTLLTALALFAVQPNVTNVGSLSDTPLLSAAASTEANTDDSNDTPIRTQGQMPEIEVEQFSGKLLHVSSLQFFEPVELGRVEVTPLLDPNEHTSGPLLRPPAA